MRVPKIGDTLTPARAALRRAPLVTPGVTPKENPASLAGLYALQLIVFIGRGGEIRTHDLLYPKQIFRHIAT